MTTKSNLGNVMLHKLFYDVPCNTVSSISYRCDRVYQRGQVLGVITMIAQRYPMITNTSRATPWPNSRGLLQIVVSIPPAGHAMSPTLATWSGCGTQRRRMYTAWLRMCVAHNWLTAAILGDISFAKTEMSANNPKKPTYRILQELGTSHMIQITQPTVLPLA